MPTMPTPATVATMAGSARKARRERLDIALDGAAQAAREGVAEAGRLHWTATSAQLAALIAAGTRHEGIWADRPTLTPVARQSLAEVTIPVSAGDPVQTTLDPDIPESAYDWYDLAQVSPGASVVRTSSDGYTVRAKRLPRRWDTRTDGWSDQWEVVEDLRDDA